MVTKREKGVNRMNKWNFSSKVWDKLENQQLKNLINNFQLNPNVESDVFQKITELIWEEGTCYPMFFETIPYLIEIASKLPIQESKDLWSYLGCWISTHDKYRSGISEEVLECFDSSLKHAEEACIKQIISVEKLDEADAQYLYASLFAFAKHRLGYMTMSGYKDDFAGTSIAKCPQGHLNDVTVYNSGIVPYEEKEKPCMITMLGKIDIGYERQENNKWTLFDKRIQQEIDKGNTSKEVKSHLELSKNIIHKGINSNLNMRYAFSLYGSLLYCNGSFDASMRVFHGLDELVCVKCGKKFIFADGWCEDQY